MRCTSFLLLKHRSPLLCNFIDTSQRNWEFPCLPSKLSSLLLLLRRLIGPHGLFQLQLTHRHVERRCFFACENEGLSLTFCEFSLFFEKLFWSHHLALGHCALFKLSAKTLDAGLYFVFLHKVSRVFITHVSVLLFGNLARAAARAQASFKPHAEFDFCFEQK